MKFKIDTEKKILTLTEKISYGELKKFMFNFIGEEASSWTVDVEPTRITEYIVNPSPIVLEPWPYKPLVPVEPSPPYNPFPVWGGTTGNPDTYPSTTITYEYPSN